VGVLMKAFPSGALEVGVEMKDGGGGEGSSSSSSSSSFKRFQFKSNSRMVVCMSPSSLC
jgi:hypothetical protein